MLEKSFKAQVYYSKAFCFYCCLNESEQQVISVHFPR